MLETWRGRLLVAAAIALTLFGLPAFLFPDWATGAFPWKVGPFLAMTIGGWALGSAVIALLASRTSRLDRVLGMHVYLWAFGSLQALVAVMFLDKLQTGHILTWPYLVALGVLVASGVVCGVDWRARRPDLRGPAGPIPRWMPVIAIALGLFTALLAVGSWISGAGGQLAQGRVFPEELSPFSMRAFAAFFAAVSAGTLSLLLARNSRPYLELDKAGFSLVGLILAACVMYVARFDVTTKPASGAYFAAYAFAAILFAVIWIGARARPELLAADPPGT